MNRNLRALGYAPKDAKLPEGGEDSITTFGGIPFSHEVSISWLRLLMKFAQRCINIGATICG